MFSLVSRFSASLFRPPSFSLSLSLSLSGSFSCFAEVSFLLRVVAQFLFKEVRFSRQITTVSVRRRLRVGRECHGCFAMVSYEEPIRFFMSTLCCMFVRLAFCEIFLPKPRGKSAHPYAVALAALMHLSMSLPLC